MQFVLGPVVQVRGPASDGTWQRLREADATLAQVLLLPISLTTGTAVLVLWLLCAPFTLPALDLAVLVAGFAILVPLHELTHAACFPHASPAGCLRIAVWPSRLVFCASCDADISRSRHLCVLAMPLLVISLGPIALSAMLGVESAHLAVFSLLNALASGGDVLAIVLVLAQVPRGALMRRVGECTLWCARGAAR